MKNGKLSRCSHVCVFHFEKNWRIETVLNTQFKYTYTQDYKRHVLYHLRELET